MWEGETKHDEAVLLSLDFWLMNDGVRLSGLTRSSRAIAMMKQTGSGNGKVDLQQQYKSGEEDSAALMALVLYMYACHVESRSSECFSIGMRGCCI